MARCLGRAVMEDGHLLALDCCPMYAIACVLDRCPVPWSILMPANATSAAGASRTAFALHVGQPVKRASSGSKGDARGGAS